MSENNILGVVLAGGKSKRFGDDKTTAKLGNKTLLNHTIEKIEQSFHEILIISNNETNVSNKKNVFSTKDLIEGHLGPLVGVLSAMEWIKKNNKNYNWIATFPCDTPFFDQNLIDKIKNCPKNSSKKLFFLKSGTRRHNVFGLWSLELKEILLEDINKGQRKVEEWANKIGSEIIEINDENDNNFLNINTKEDLEKAKKKIK
jgi:molybdopterin-guanine dinucleotide biosynthesis protein A